ACGAHRKSASRLAQSKTNGQAPAPRCTPRTMSFTSWEFAVLLASVFALYWRLPWRGRIWLLLGASYFFYGAWDARFLALHFTTTIVDFYAALAMEKRRIALKQVAAMTSLPALWLLFCKVAHVQNHDVAWPH